MHDVLLSIGYNSVGGVHGKPHSFENSVRKKFKKSRYYYFQIEIIMPMDSDYLREQLPELAKHLATVAAEKRGDPIAHLVQLLRKEIELLEQNA